MTEVHSVRRRRSPLQGLRCCLKDSLLNIAFLVFAGDHEADVFRLVALKDKPFVLCLNECETARNAGENSAHAMSRNLLESLHHWEFFLVKRGVLRDSEDDIGRLSFLQFVDNVLDEE